MEIRRAAARQHARHRHLRDPRVCLAVVLDARWSLVRRAVFLGRSVLLIFVGWLAYHYIPDVHDFIQQFGTDCSDPRFRV